MAQEKLDKDLKDIAMAIIEAKGQGYDEWLNEAHRKLVFENTKLIKESLKLKKEMDN